MRFQKSAPIFKSDQESLKVTVTIQLSKIFLINLTPACLCLETLKIHVVWFTALEKVPNSFKGGEVYNCFLSNAFSNGIHSGERLELTKTLLKTVMERDREMEKDKPPKVKYRTKEKTSNTGERKGTWIEGQVGEGNGVRWSLVWQSLFVVSFCCRSIDQDCSAAGPVA